MRARDENLLVSRNFYGTLRVRDYADQRRARRSLINGTIGHGYQYAAAAYRNVAGSYYSVSSGVGRALAARAARGPVRLGVIGLGVGVLTSYARQGGYLRVHEINPDVVGIAGEYSSFLSRARQKGADVKVLTGDARLTLDRQEPQHFDLGTLHPQLTLHGVRDPSGAQSRPSGPIDCLILSRHRPGSACARVEKPIRG